VTQASRENLARAPEVLCGAVNAGCDVVSAEMPHGSLNQADALFEKFNDDGSPGVIQSESNTWKALKGCRCFSFSTAKSIRKPDNGLAAPIGSIRSKGSKVAATCSVRNTPERRIGFHLRSEIPSTKTDCASLAL